MFSIGCLFCIQHHLTFTNTTPWQGQPFNKVIQAALMKGRVFDGDWLKKERHLKAESRKSALESSSKKRSGPLMILWVEVSKIRGSTRFMCVYVCMRNKQGCEDFFLLMCFIIEYMCVCSVNVLQRNSTTSDFSKLKFSTLALAYKWTQGAFVSNRMNGGQWEPGLVASLEGWEPREVWWWMNDRTRGSDCKICSSREGETATMEGNKREKKREGLLSQYQVSPMAKVLL